MSLLQNTYDLLDASPLTLRLLSAEADVGYWWLSKFKQRKFKDPGVRRVEKLHQFLTSKHECEASAGHGQS